MTSDDYCPFCFLSGVSVLYASSHQAFDGMQGTFCCSVF